MIRHRLIIGTRGSDLALAQTGMIASDLEHLFDVEIRVIRTDGDRNVSVPLRDADTTGMFTHALENALLEGGIDIAVHSLKDLPLQSHVDLSIAAIPLRENSADFLIISKSTFDSEAPKLPLRQNASVGTGSPRREAQLLNVRNDLSVEPIRGNINTRFEKLKAERYDAIILAAAGVNRLGLDLTDFHVHELPISQFIPAPGQAALGIQMRSRNKFYDRIRKRLNDPITEMCVTAERQLLKLFGGGCSMPLGVLIRKEKDGFRFHGFWYNNNVAYTQNLFDKEIDNGVDRLYKQLTGQKK